MSETGSNKAEDFGRLADNIMQVPRRADDEGNEFYLIAFSPHCMGMVVASLRLMNQSLEIAERKPDEKLH